MTLAIRPWIQTSNAWLVVSISNSKSLWQHITDLTYRIVSLTNHMPMSNITSYQQMKMKVGHAVRVGCCQAMGPSHHLSPSQSNQEKRIPVQTLSLHFPPTPCRPVQTPYPSYSYTGVKTFPTRDLNRTKKQNQAMRSFLHRCL